MAKGKIARESGGAAASERGEIAAGAARALDRHIRPVDINGQPRLFRRLRARWLRWQKPRRRR